MYDDLKKYKLLSPIDFNDVFLPGFLIAMLASFFIASEGKVNPVSYITAIKENIDDIPSLLMLIICGIVMLFFFITILVYLIFSIINVLMTIFGKTYECRIKSVLDDYYKVCVLDKYILIPQKGKYSQGDRLNIRIFLNYVRFDQ